MEANLSDTLRTFNRAECVDWLTEVFGEQQADEIVYFAEQLGNDVVCLTAAQSVVVTFYPTVDAFSSELIDMLPGVPA